MKPSSRAPSADELWVRFKQQKAAAAAGAGMAAASSNSAAASSTAVSAVASSPAALPSLDSFTSQLDRRLALLLDASSTPSTRRSALEWIEEQVGSERDLRVGSLASAPASSPDSSSAASSTTPAPCPLPRAYLSALFSPRSLKTLLKCFGPPLDERSRTLAVQIVTRGVRTVPEGCASSLHLLVATLAVHAGTIDLSRAPVTLGANTAMHERSQEGMEQQEVARREAEDSAQQTKKGESSGGGAKKSEYERVCQLTLLHELLRFCPRDQLGYFLPALCSILASSLTSDAPGETAPDVGQLACDCLALLGEEHAQQMRAYARPLLVVVMQRTLLHPLARVRLSAVGAVRALVPCGAAEVIRDLAAFREHNVIDIHGFFHGEARVNYMARLVADENPRVRAAFLRMLNEWSLTLYERSDYETLLMPYVFTGLSDSLPHIRSEALETMRRAGAAFEQEEKERQAGGVGGSAADEGAFRIKLAAEEETRAWVRALGPSLLFPPFTQRPGWGERQIARKFLDRLLYAMLSEVGDWKGGVRDRSWSLLRVLLLYAEEHITQYCSKLVSAIVGEVSSSLASREQPLGAVWDVCALVARYTDPTFFLRAMADAATGASAHSDRLRAVFAISAYSMRFLPHTHPNFLPALQSFVDSLLHPSNQLCFSSSLSLFSSFVDVLSGMLALEGLSHRFMGGNAPRLFRTLLECAAWSRAKLGVQIGTEEQQSTVAESAASTEPSTATPSLTPPDSLILSQSSGSSLRAQHAHLASTIDAAYLSLLHRLDPQEDDLLLAFQLYLLPLLRELSDQASFVEWSEQSVQLGVLLEVLRKVGASGVFVALSTDESPKEGDSDAKHISALLQDLLLRLVRDNPLLSVHSLLMTQLEPVLRSSNAHFRPSFLHSFLAHSLTRSRSLLADYTHSLSALPSATNGGGGLHRRSHEEQRVFEAKVRAREVMEQRANQWASALNGCVAAVLDRVRRNGAMLGAGTQLAFVSVDADQPSSLTLPLLHSFSSFASATPSALASLTDSHTAAALLGALQRHAQNAVPERQEAALRILAAYLRAGHLSPAAAATHVPSLPALLDQLTSSSLHAPVQRAAEEARNLLSEELPNVASLQLSEQAQ